MLSRLRKILEWLQRNLTRTVAWDLFMVYVAVLNVSLIVFDLTYLSLRPLYSRHLPVVTRIYDPVKGIEPEPVTRNYLALVDVLRAAGPEGSDPAAVEVTLEELRRQSAEFLEHSPFERSGLERYRIRLFKGMEAFLVEEGAIGEARRRQLEVSDLFWSLEPGPERLASRVTYFENELAPLLEANFFRRYGINGRLVDHFWLLDLPFLVLFIIEFLVRWYLAVRRSTYLRWFLFPIFNWYDVLSVMPAQGLRLFRLFRIASIYVRLHRSERTIVGDDPISRTVQYFANIISEEISDMVSLRILNETQEELRDGTHKRIIHTVAAGHRDALAAQLGEQLRHLLNDAEVRRQARAMLDASLENAVESADALRRVPLPDAVLRPLVSTIGETVFDALADTLAATVSTPAGRDAVEEMVGSAVDGLVSELTEGELERIVREVSIEVIEHMKETVAVRKWTLPDQPRHSILTREVKP